MRERDATPIERERARAYTQHAKPTSLVGLRNKPLIAAWHAHCVAFTKTTNHMVGSKDLSFREDGVEMTNGIQQDSDKQERRQTSKLPKKIKMMMTHKIGTDEGGRAQTILGLYPGVLV